MKETIVVIGTRRSKLAQWQANAVKEQLESRWPALSCRLQFFVTEGDRILDRPLPQIGGKGLFTAEMESALRAGRIDLAVHSLKDLPVDDAPGLRIAIAGQRADVRDVLVARKGWTMATLPEGARIGTGSLRRKAQLLAYRPDLAVRSIRGNVDTRIGKTQSGDYDAVVLAAAGVIRLGLAALISDKLPLSVMLPAPGQGALAVQYRAGDNKIAGRLAMIDDVVTHRCVTAERAFLAGLGSGCSLPVAALATLEDEQIQLSGLVANENGTQAIKVAGFGRDPLALGSDLAQQAIAQGAAALLP